MSDATGLGKLVPGFDFLQSLVKNAGAALPGIGQWVAPTLDPAELDKRIGELRTVQYWLEQNARMLAATIQALEVQRMTLSTLKSMNVQMADLGESLKIKPFEVPAAAASSAAAAPPAPSDTSPVAARTKKPTVPTPGQAIDPMQWWGALTTQFAELATNAMKDTAADAAKSIAGGMVKQSMEAATETMKQAAGAPGSAAAEAARIFGGKPAASSAATKKAAKRRRPGSAAA